LCPQTLQATKAKPAKIIAPPTPTTTPMIVFLAEVLRPELPESPLELRAAEVVAGTGVEEVYVCATVLPLTYLTVVITTGERVLEGGAEVVVEELAGFDSDVDVVE